MRAQPLHQLESRRSARGGLVADLRFRSLLGRDVWETLPPAVQARFSKRLSSEAVALYRGHVVRADLSFFGWLLAQVLRLIGAPLPICRDTGGPAIVVVSEDAAGGGQVWSRLYGRRSGFPQVIHSAKRFAGPTGLEEYIGRGIGMALRVEAMLDGLRFISDHYFLTTGSVRLCLPRCLEPGRTVVEHHDLGDGSFLFTLTLEHPWLGLLVKQESEFRDA